jgi:hypothetical protein
MIDETEVKTRHKRKLAEIRDKPDVSRNGKIDRGYPEIAGSSIQRTQRSDEGNIDGASSREEGMDSGEGANGGFSQGIRPLEYSDVNPIESTSRGNDSPGTTSLTSDLTPEQKQERERELARQRKARQRDREKEEAAQTTSQYSSSNSDGDSPVSDISMSRFQFKNPFHVGGTDEKVKLFSKKEATDEQEHLAFLFFHGSALLDTFLEIVVKDHEPVAIWAMEEAEADMFAEMHLARATKDVGAARIAREALALYDKWFMLAYLTPLSIRTRSYIKEHRCFSFI